MRKRKEFIMSHPKKIEICKKILEARKDKKCITFSATIKDSEAIGIGEVIHSKKSKAKNKEIKAKIEPQFIEYAKKLKRKYDVSTVVSANDGTVTVDLGNNLRIKMSKSINNKTYFDFGTENGWEVSSSEIRDFIERADEIKKLMADFKKFEINI